MIEEPSRRKAAWSRERARRSGARVHCRHLIGWSQTEGVLRARIIRSPFAPQRVGGGHAVAFMPVVPCVPSHHLMLPQSAPTQRASTTSRRFIGTLPM